MSLLTHTWRIFAKDMLIEWRSRTRFQALFFFSLSTLLIFSFAIGPDSTILRQHAGSYLWLALLFASSLSLQESFRIEMDNGALEGLRLAPVDLYAVFLGKTLANTALLFGLSCVMLPLSAALFSFELRGGISTMLVVALMGSAALSAPGTVYSALSSQTRARDVMLPLMMFPAVIPALLATTKATRIVIEGDAMGELSSWLTLLGAFLTIYWSLGFALFPKLIEET